MKEIRVYLIEADSEGEHLEMPNNEFMTLAEEQGTVYTLKSFEDAINSGDMDILTSSFVRFIQIES